MKKVVLVCGWSPYYADIEGISFETIRGLHERRYSPRNTECLRF
ncbi:hypothetical protein [Pediococcus acidilactici]|nr:hypothetical protein [Pediococcus acidilactici]